LTIYFELIGRISTRFVSFYTIKLKNSEITEYDKFCNKFFPDHVREKAILDKTLFNMGLSGAKPRYFEKPEKGAYALPSVKINIKKANKKDFGIRLYCIYISPSIVILLNGDIKTVDGPAQLCPNVKDHFNRAVSLVSKLKKANDMELVSYEPGKLDFEEDYLLDI